MSIFDVTLQRTQSVTIRVAADTADSAADFARESFDETPEKYPPTIDTGWALASVRDARLEVERDGREKE